MKRWVPLAIVTAVLLFAVWVMPKNFTGVIGAAENITTQDFQAVTLSSGLPMIIFMALIVAGFFLLNRKLSRKRS